MANVPRKHHYVPIVLLKGFSHDGTETGKLHIVDLVQKKPYESTPRGTGTKKDYNLIEVPGKDPAAIERGWFADHIEGPVGQAFEKLRNDEPLVEEDQQRLVIFMAAQALRAPSIRQMYDSFSTQIMRNHLRLLAAHDGAFKKARDTDPEFADITPGDLRGWAEHHVVAWSSTDHLRAQLPAFTPILHSLARRSWMILTSTEDFVCTDAPVATISPDRHRRGFAALDANVFMPVGSRCGLFGTWIERQVWCKGAVDRETVAALNATLLHHATRFVASRDTDFSWVQADGTIGNRAAVLAHL